MLFSDKSKITVKTKQKKHTQKIFARESNPGCRAPQSGK